MTDTRKESLSALIDGEASEIEVHRLVREFRFDESLSDSWAVYQHVRSTVRSGDVHSALSPEHQRVLLDRIRDAIEAEDNHQHDAVQPAGTAKVVMGSMALAASLVVAVFLGVQKPQEQAELAATPDRPAVEVQTAATEPQTSELVELDEEKQKRLRAYLNQHDRMARMNANQQLVNYEDRNGN